MRGHIRKRGKSWSIVVELGRDPVTGKRKQQWQSIKGTKKDAERALAKIIHDLDKGISVKPTKMTVGEFLEQWLKDYVASNTSPRTAERYTQMIRLHLIPNLGNIPLSQLRPDHVQSFYARALDHGRIDGKGGLSNRSVHHLHRVLSEALSHAVKWGLAVRNVCSAVDPPRPEKKETTTLASEDVPRLLEEARALEDTSGNPYYMLFLTALHTGMRRGELLGLRWCDVDLDMATISVNRSLQVLRDGGLVVREPKTPKARRLIAMTPSLASELREHQSNQEIVRAAIGKRLNAEDLVFGQMNGEPLNPNTVSPAFAKVANRAGLKLRLHDLRHSHATLMLKAGIHPKIVSERLGHATVAFTLDTYSHVVPGLQEAAAVRFDEVLQGSVVEKERVF